MDRIARTFVVPNSTKFTATVKTVPAMTVSIVSCKGSTQDKPFFCMNGMMASYMKDSRTQTSSRTRNKASITRGRYSAPSVPSIASPMPLPKPYRPSLAGHTGLKVSGVSSGTSAAVTSIPPSTAAAMLANDKPPTNAPNAGSSSDVAGACCACGVLPGAGTKQPPTNLTASKAKPTAKPNFRLELAHPFVKGFLLIACCRWESVTACMVPSSMGANCRAGRDRSY
mmetsp:Transcript_54473/g.100734  ORF Transcript_54473/g.100734 Transcript_54473/m.100734 type:complete len:226 (+) Transcript_54473:471-1148(+)